MTGEEFAQAHAKWKYGTGKAETAEEQPGTWMITKDGYYFGFKGGRKALEEQRQVWDEMCCLHQNTTSIIMAKVQAYLRASQK